MKISFVGTGAMGRPMARNLLRAGHTVTAYNRSRDRAEQLRPDGARIAATAAEAVQDAEVLVTMLADDQALGEVLLRSGRAIEALPRGAVHLSMSTISPSLAALLAEEHGARGQTYVAAPVFGRPEAAAEAKLYIVIAGPREAIERCWPLLEAMGRGSQVVDDKPPAANIVKLAGNFLIASMLEALGETFALMRKSGIGAQTFLDIANEALFHSPLYASYGGKIADESFEPAGFRLRLGLKDIKLLLQAGEERAVPMPLASLVRDRLLTAMAHGRGEADWAAMAAVSGEQSGLAKAA